jgi:xanthine dehydrogenase accessory factor
MTQSTSTAPDVDDLLAAALQRDGKVAIATIIETWGSAPVPVGGQMGVAADGTFAGSVSGGCVEAEVITEAMELLDAGGPPRTLSFGVEDETAWRVGLPCGGRIRVFVERLEGAAGAAHVTTLATARKNRHPLIIRTHLTTGVRNVVTRDSVAPDSELGRRFLSGLSTIETNPTSETFVHARLPPPRIVLIGATHIAQVLAELVRLSGFHAIVVDPRTAFAADARFPGVQLITEWPQDALPVLGLDPYTAVAALAHVGHIDDEALKLGCKSECFYVGALGSRKNHAKRCERLAEAGLTAVEIGRIRSPIGLDLGATTPPEIAVSVMAEILRHLRGLQGKLICLCDPIFCEPPDARPVP